MSGDRVRWEFRLGVVHVVVLLGIITGSMVVAFVFGYVSGQKLGYDQAQNSSLANTARYPIAGDAYQNEINSESVSQVYAKLNDTRAPETAPAAEPEPELASIKGAEEAPVIEDLAAALIPDAPAKKEAAVADGLRPDAVDAPEQAPAGAPPAGKQDSTLGALVKAQRADDAAAPTLDQAVKDRLAAVEQEEEKKAEKAAEKPAPTPAPAAKINKPAAAKIASGWYAQVAAPHRREDAQRLADQLRASGFPIVIEPANVNGQEYFRVLAGPETSRALADRLVNQLAREKGVQNKPFTKMVP